MFKLKIVLKDFDYLGEHIEEFVCEFPQAKEIDSDALYDFIWYACEELNSFVDFQNSFKVEKAH